jgi:hypothetical protein
MGQVAEALDILAATARKGAFAPFLEQPVVSAILVPLGSAGGVQLIETFLMGRV